MTCKVSMGGCNVQSRLRTTELGRGEGLIIQNEAHVHRPGLQNGGVPTTPTERRKAVKQVFPLSSQMAKERDTREPKVKKLSHRKIKHGPTRAFVASVFAPSTSHCAATSYGK